MAGWLYIFRENGNDRIVKVGRAKGDEKAVCSRFRKAMNSTIRGLSVVALWQFPSDDYKHAEREVHRSLNDRALPPRGKRREWFYTSPDDAVQLCETIVGFPASYASTNLPFDPVSLPDYDFLRQKKIRDLLRIWVHEEQRADDLPPAVKISCNGWWQENWIHKTYSPWPLKPTGCWTPTLTPVKSEAIQEMNARTRELHSRLAKEFGDIERHNKIIGWSNMRSETIQAELETAGYHSVPLFEKRPPEGFEFSM